MKIYIALFCMLSTSGLSLASGPYTPPPHGTKSKDKGDKKKDQKKSDKSEKQSKDSDKEKKN